MDSDQVTLRVADHDLEATYFKLAKLDATSGDVIVAMRKIREAQFWLMEHVKKQYAPKP